MTGGITGVALAVMAGAGVYLLFTAVAFGWRGLSVAPRLRSSPVRDRSLRRLLGLAGIPLGEVVGIAAALAVIGAGGGFAVFGGVVAPSMLAAFAGSAPLAATRARRRRKLAQAAEAWPRMIEEIRLQATSMGRSLPQAVLTVGLAGPEELRPAFVVAQREWLVSTDFARTLSVLKRELADATADIVCETLLVAHEVGGTDIDARLAALATDRGAEVGIRKEAESKQAGARFARRFVLIVPFGMAVAGLSIGQGREAYATTAGQIGVGIGIALLVACWIWAGAIMRLPATKRVFAE